MPKFKARTVTIDNIKFNSLGKGERYWKLRDSQEKGDIYDLEVNVQFNNYVKDKFICSYFAAFRYRYKRGLNEVVVVEDVKTEITTKNPTYRIKKKLTEACHNIKIIEIRSES